MRTILYSLAGIGAIVVLTIGSCVLLLTLGIDVPDYATSEYFKSNYLTDIRTITERIRKNETIKYGGSDSNFHQDIVAILQLKKNSSTGDPSIYEDIYKKFLIEKASGHSLSNHIGVTNLIESSVEDMYLVYEIEVNELEYWICFRTKAG